MKTHKVKVTPTTEGTTSLTISAKESTCFMPPPPGNI